ncbi:MAG: hypothetical protein ACI9BW_003157 [Gammaproteobacteria bacterium]|jgi:hypothetical protein
MGGSLRPMISISSHRKVRRQAVSALSCRFALWTALACLLATFSMNVAAGSADVISAESDLVNDMVVVSAELDFTFSEDAMEAMRSGIALFIDVDFRIKRQRRFIWDPKVVYLSRRYRIERHALTDRYVITDLLTDDRRIHNSLDAAITDLGNIRGVPIADQANFDPASDYRIGIRARLDLESLPAPIRPIAYISPGWRMSSGWFQWTLPR